MSAKTKDILLKNIQGSNTQDGEDQKRQMVSLELNCIFIIKASLYWVSAICS